MSRILQLLALAALLAVLHGCAAVAVGGAAGGAVLIGDRRTVGTITEDQGIELKTARRIDEKLGDKAHVNATSYNRIVLLTGEVPDQAAKDAAENIARSVENVRNVVNELSFGPPSTFPARTSDSYITSKVKARIVDANKFNPLYVKVVTEVGVVYLLGLVHKREAADATEIARTTGGVSKVVRVFEFLD